MKLIHDHVRGRFVAETTFEERHLPKAARFRWDAVARCWWTKSETDAARLIEFADDDLKARLQGAAEKAQVQAAADAKANAAREAVAVAAREASRAGKSDLDIPVPDGLTYLPFQVAGIAYAINKDGVLLGDEMGLGKTIQALGIINAKPEIKRVLVICPASLRLNWAREAAKWLVRPSTIRIAVGGKKRWELVHGSDDADVQVDIINYDLLGKYDDELRADGEWDLLVCDEAHYMKNPKALRTKRVLGFGKWDRSKKAEVFEIEPMPAKQRVFLTGTPITNRPKELWPLAHALAPAEFKSWWTFSKRYCDAHRTQWGWDFDGSSHLDELQDLVRGSFMVRRLKQDVLKDLPPKRRQVIEIAPNGAAKVVAKEKAAYEAGQERLASLRADVELAKADTSDVYDAAVGALTEASQVVFEEISELRHETALAKVPQVVEHLTGILDESAKVVLFAHHKDVVALLARALKEFGVVTLTGDHDMNTRQAAVDSFQNDDSIRVFIGTIGAAGVGHTLTAAAHVVFAELDWVPANITQAEDRCHRIGQTGSVLIQHLVLDGSLDAQMVKTLVRKQDVIDRALDTKHEPRKDTPEDLKVETSPQAPQDALEQAKKMVAAEVDLTEKKDAETASRRVGREKIAEAARNLTTIQIQAIHEGLQHLSSVCDGALLEDGQGFNKPDSHIGKRLAAKTSLTAEQAALGQLFVRKYQGQLDQDLVAVALGR